MGAPNWWTTRRFGLLVHANVATVPAFAPVGQYASWYRAHIDGGVSDVLLHPSPLVESLAHHRDRWSHIDHYDDFMPFLTFEHWDADAWTGLAQDAGMGYAVIVAKHHDGWCWWDAPDTERTVLQHGPGRNVLGEFAAACERAELAFGTYYSLLDWRDDRYGDCQFVEQVVHPHVLDLVERYGSRFLWGDGHWGRGESHWRSDELIARCHRVDPGIVVNDRWWWNGPGVASYEYRLPDDIVTSAWEHRRGIGSSLSLNRAEPDDHLLSGPDIVALLTEVVAKGGHLLLSIGPDATGALPPVHAERLRAAGRWVRAHQELIDTARPWTRWGDATTRYLVTDDGLHAVDLDGSGHFDAVVRDAGTVTSVTDAAGDSVGFVQGDAGLTLDLRPGADHRWPTVFRIALDEPPPAPIALFGDDTSPPRHLADELVGVKRGDIVRLGEGRYLGPARIPDGVTVRGLGPDRTVIDGIESEAVVLGARSRIEHCALTGGGDRIVWLPKSAISIVGHHAAMIGCRVDGHVDITAADVKVSSCAATGLIARHADRLVVARCHVSGMNWDCGIDLQDGSNQLIESCEFDALLVAIRCTGTIGTVVRNNAVTARWWGVQLIDGEGAQVSGNSFESTMRAVDVDGGTLAEVTGNAVRSGDSGCVVQRGAADCSVAGNHWERCRIGLLAWEAGAVRHHDNTAIDLSEPDAAVVIGP